MGFNTIPTNLRLPGVYQEVDGSKSGGASTSARKTLLLGIQTSAAIVAEGTPTQITSAADAAAKFGVGSMLALMAKYAFGQNGFGEHWAIPMDEASAGTAATATIQVTTPATATGMLHLYVAGVYVPVSIAAGDAVGTIASAIAAALNDAAADLPFTTSAATDTATLVMRWKGQDGNAIPLALNVLDGQVTPAGVTFAFNGAASPAESFDGFFGTGTATAGAGVVDLTTAITAMAEDKYDYVISPFTHPDSDLTVTDIQELGTELDDTINGRWGPLRQLYGLVFGAHAASSAGLTTKGNALNDEHISLIGYQNSNSPYWAWAADYGAAMARELEQDPARPAQTVRLNVMAPPRASRFGAATRNTLLFDGITTWYADRTGRVHIERAITTYQTNAASQPDVTFLDVMTPAVLQLLLEERASLISTSFGRKKLADVGTPVFPLTNVITAQTVRAALVSQYAGWIERGLVENTKDFQKYLTVTRNGNVLEVLDPPDLINQFITYKGQMQFRLDYGEA